MAKWNLSIIDIKQFGEKAVRSRKRHLWKFLFLAMDALQGGLLRKAGVRGRQFAMAICDGNLPRQFATTSPLLNFLLTHVTQGFENEKRIHHEPRHHHE
jgi:hypothetical protein